MKKNRQAQKSQPAKRKVKFLNNTLEAQRARLIDLLKIAPRTTTELRNRYSIMSPAARVLELRKQGHNITLDWIEQYDAAGIKHRAGRYCLIAEVVHEQLARFAVLDKRRMPGDPAYGVLAPAHEPYNAQLVFDF